MDEKKSVVILKYIMEHVKKVVWGSMVLKFTLLLWLKTELFLINTAYLLGLLK